MHGDGAVPMTDGIRNQILQHLHHLDGIGMQHGQRIARDCGIVLLDQPVEVVDDIVTAGGDPVGVAFDEDSAYVKFDAGQFLDEASA